ncbi:MAG TPA: LysR family transcriptional regulator [Aquificaceae bacterium]|nr:LysR family transcriptional regulator [Aquificaceae bacterium]
MMKLKYKIWFEKDGEPVLTELKYRILKGVKETGSIKETSKRLEISYKKTLEHLKAMESRLGYKVVIRERGKGAELTEKGEKLLRKYEEAKRVFENVTKLFNK